MCLSIYAHEMHLIMGAVSRPCTYVHGPKKTYPSFQRLRPTAGTGRCGITATSTMASVDAHNGHATTPAQPTSTTLSMYCIWRNSMTMGICPCAMTEISTTTMNCNCGESTVCSCQKDEDRPQYPKVLFSHRRA